MLGHSPLSSVHLNIVDHVSPRVGALVRRSGVLRAVEVSILGELYHE